MRYRQFPGLLLKRSTKLTRQYQTIFTSLPQINPSLIQRRSFCGSGAKLTRILYQNGARHSTPLFTRVNSSTDKKIIFTFTSQNISSPLCNLHSYCEPPLKFFPGHFKITFDNTQKYRLLNTIKMSILRKSGIV